MDTQERESAASPEFQFLAEKALQLGAKEVKVIPASQIVIENRVTLKCRSGCIAYGQKLTCPPYVPTPDQFREIVREYRSALLVKFSSDVNADPDVIRSIYKYWLDPSAPVEKKQMARTFWDEYFHGSKMILPIILELEKTAFNAGYIFALALSNGSCRLCEKCNTKEGICLHPQIARIPEHAVGINMKKTAELAGMPITFPCVEHPEPMALLLID
jgi:predicted metal-binding protein